MSFLAGLTAVLRIYVTEETEEAANTLPSNKHL